MAKLAKISLVLVALVIICVQSDVVQIRNENVEFWGDLTTKTIRGISIAKTGFPFFTRSFVVTYPEVFFVFFFFLQRKNMIFFFQICIWAEIRILKQKKMSE